MLKVTLKIEGGSFLLFKISFKKPTKYSVKVQPLFEICSTILKYLNLSLGGITSICFPLISSFKCKNPLKKLPIPSA